MAEIKGDCAGIGFGMTVASEPSIEIGRTAAATSSFLIPVPVGGSTYPAGAFFFGGFHRGVLSAPADVSPRARSAMAALGRSGIMGCEK